MRGGKPVRKGGKSREREKEGELERRRGELCP